MSKTNSAINSRSGYGASRFNATKHGLTSARTILPGEDPREYEAMHADLVAEFEPAGPSEAYWVTEIANLMWRKERLHRAEAAAVRSALGDYIMSRFVPDSKPFHKWSDVPEEQRLLFEELIALFTQEPEQAEAMLAEGEDESAVIATLLERLEENDNDVDHLVEQLPEDVGEYYRRGVELESRRKGADRFWLRQLLLTKRQSALDFQRKFVGVYREVHDAALRDVAVDGFYNTTARHEAHLDRQLERAYKKLFAIKQFKANSLTIGQ